MFQQRSTPMNQAPSQRRVRISTSSIIACCAAALIVAQWLGTSNAVFAPVDRAIGRGGRPDQASALRASYELWQRRWQLRENVALRQLQRRASDIGLTAVNICGSLEAQPGVLAEAYAIAAELERRQPMEEPHNRKRLCQRGTRIKELAERLINP
jgi:hypothetical protein